MLGFDQLLIYLVRVLGGLYLSLVLLRFILQLTRADFYNPVSQLIVRLTHPVLKPLRRIIPGFAGIDFSSLVLAVLIQMLIMAALMMLIVGNIANPLQLMAWALIVIADLIIIIFFGALIIMVILSWVAPGSYHPAALLIHQITAPLLYPVRRLLPPLGGLDLSPIVVFIGLQVIRKFILGNLAYITQMPAVFIWM